MTRYLKYIAYTLISLLTVAVLFIGCIYFHGAQYLAAYSGYGFAHALPAAESSQMLSPTQCSSPTLKVLTYNVRYGSHFIETVRNQLGKFAPGDYLPWSVRSTEINKLIASYTPDLIGLQEMHTDKDIASIVSLEHYQLVSYHLENFEYGDSALLFNKARFALLDSGQIWLGPFPKLPLSLGFRRLAVIRYANWAVLQEKSSGFIFVFTNTHFDNDTDNKEKSSALFYEKIAKLSSHYPLIVVGDFNTRASAPRYQRLIGGDENPPRLLNSYDLRPAGISAAMQHPNDLIDHILAGGPCMVTTRHWQVDTRTLENGNTLSDHNPLIAELQFAGFKP